MNCWIPIISYLDLHIIRDHQLLVEMKIKTAGLGGHTDGNFLTFISQNQVNGLQINKNGEWIDVNISPNSCVVLAGDSFKVSVI